MSALYVFLGGGIGSLLRYGIGRLISSYYTGSLPVGTFISNFLACLILALIVLLVQTKTLQGNWIQPLILIGVCGGLSTFSTFSAETFSLIENGQIFAAIANMVLSIGLGISVIYFILSKSN